MDKEEIKSFLRNIGENFENAQNFKPFKKLSDDELHTYFMWISRDLDKLIDKHKYSCRESYLMFYKFLCERMKEAYEPDGFDEKDFDKFWEARDIWVRKKLTEYGGWCQVHIHHPCACNPWTDKTFFEMKKEIYLKEKKDEVDFNLRMQR